jgi:hypothetical protein
MGNWRHRYTYSGENGVLDVTAMEEALVQYLSSILADGIRRSWRTGLPGVVKWRGVSVDLLGTSV